ncbi:MAG TPA: hypothetical protein VLJ57_07295 [Burkholderiaceae bacterium]|nr:hypothetical protein [Burkholderiaceae bacterium]
MTASSIEVELSTLEQRLNAVSADLVSGDALELESHSRQLRQAMADFAQAMGGSVLPPATLSRLVRISQTLARQRENLLRRAVVVDRALASFLPASDAATYSHSLGKKGAAGAAGAARIYAARAT